MNDPRFSKVIGFEIATKQQLCLYRIDPDLNYDSKYHLITEEESPMWRLNQLYYVREPVTAIAVNSFWYAYHMLILATTLCFNWPEVEAETAPLDTV